nr:pulmonary surfactant-associated protein D-like [Globicephala melas]
MSGSQCKSSRDVAGGDRGAPSCGLPHLPSSASTHPWAWDCGDGGGGGSELPAAPPGQEGAEPPSWRAEGRVGREPRGCGEELGEGSEEERRAREGERGAGAAGRREVGLETARARKEPPGRRGGGATPGAGLGVTAEMRQSPAGRRGAARGRGPGRVSPRSAPACPGGSRRLRAECGLKVSVHPPITGPGRERPHSELLNTCPPR